MVIDYIPIDCQYIKDAIYEIANLYNGYLYNCKYDDVFTSPIIIHGLVASLQMFKDGNTRMGRLMQHILMWKLVNDKTPYSFDKPPIYATMNSQYRKEYRDKITQLVKDNNDESWNNWLVFNLRRVEDQIYKNNMNLEVFTRTLRK